MYAKFKKIEVSVPSSFKVKALNYISIKLTWNKVSDASGYQVYKYCNGKYVLIKDFNGNSFVTTYRNKTGYYSYYKIRAYKKISNKVYYSKFSNVLYAKPFLSTPGDVSIKKAGSKRIKIAWNRVIGSSGYSIYRYNSKSKGYVLIGSTRSLYFYNKNLKSRSIYYYKVKAYGVFDGKKVYSNYSKVVRIRV